jgi:hypothetical protein
MDQHANAFSETLQQTVAEGIRPGIVPENGMGQKTVTVIGTKANDRAGRTTPNVKFNIAPKSAPRTVIGGKALKDWIQEKGFNGETTSSQRALVGQRKGPLRGANAALKSHLQE